MIQFTANQKTIAVIIIYFAVGLLPLLITPYWSIGYFLVSAIWVGDFIAGWRQWGFGWMFDKK